MKICLVHNEYGKFSGEEAVVAQQRDLLKGRGHDVRMFTRSSADISDTLSGKAHAFFSGIYSRSSRKIFCRELESFTPDLIHIHNLFPLISPSILPECRTTGIPVVMTLHNFRLICPNALLFSHHEICRKCLGGREWHCVLRNCEGSLSKSLGYALRTAVSRQFRWFFDNVDVFICLTEFQRQIYISQGFPPDRCVVIPNFISLPVTPPLPHSALSAPDLSSSSLPHSAFPTPPPPPTPHHSPLPTHHPPLTTPHSPPPTPFLLYAGRISPEKDVPTLLEAARLLPELAFRIAGSYWRMPDLPKQAPSNVTFLGELPSSALSDLYEQATIVVFATRWFEGFPMVLPEAMSHSKPVICTDIGGLGEIVEDGVTGRLCRTGDARHLADTITELWQDPELCTALGTAGRRKVEMQYGSDSAYTRLMAAYEMAGSERTHGSSRLSLGIDRMRYLT